jgi:hypothetical protein
MLLNSPAHALLCAAGANVAISDGGVGTNFPGAPVFIAIDFPDTGD